MELTSKAKYNKSRRHCWVTLQREFCRCVGGGLTALCDESSPFDPDGSSCSRGVGLEGWERKRGQSVCLLFRAVLREIEKETDVLTKERERRTSARESKRTKERERERRRALHCYERN